MIGIVKSHQRKAPCTSDSVHLLVKIRETWTSRRNLLTATTRSICYSCLYELTHLLEDPRVNFAERDFPFRKMFHQSHYLLQVYFKTAQFQRNHTCRSVPLAENGSIQRLIENE